MTSLPSLDAGTRAGSWPARQTMAEAIQIEQLMSAPQHMGDLIFPQPDGHSEI